MTLLNTCFVQAKDIVTRCIAGETIIVPVRSHVVDLDAIYTLNETGTLIWDCLDGHTHGQEIVESVCRTFEVLQDEASQDVIDFLDGLQTRGLISTTMTSEG